MLLIIPQWICHFLSDHGILTINSLILVSILLKVTQSNVRNLVRICEEILWQGKCYDEIITLMKRILLKSICFLWIRIYVTFQYDTFCKEHSHIFNKMLVNFLHLNYVCHFKPSLTDYF